MAFRSLTDVFLLMRNNAVQNKRLFQHSSIYSRSSAYDRDKESTALMSDDDLERGDFKEEKNSLIDTRSSRLPPEWCDGLEEVQYEIARIREKLKDLNSLHGKHLTRPTFSESVDEEHSIEILTQEITQMFNKCQIIIKRINRSARLNTDQEQKLCENVVGSLVRQLQDLTMEFRKSQSAYLSQIESRNKRSQFYFGDGKKSSGGNFFDKSGDTDNNGPFLEEIEDISLDRGFTHSQMLFVEENTAEVEQRGKEIENVVRSISDLNEILKDLSTMVHEQGALVDRIDYNIEQTATYVDEGYKQLQKAEKSQKKNRKMLIIISLAVIIIILFVILVIVKS